MSAITASVAVNTSASDTDMTELTVSGVATAGLTAFGDGIAVLVEIAVHAGAAIASRNAFAPSRVSGVTYFAFLAIVIAQAGGAGLTDTPAVAILALTAGIVGLANAAVVLADLA